MLAAIPRNEAADLISDIMAAQRGESYDDGKERWRSDPYVANAWPEMALNLYWWQYFMLGASRSRADTEAISTIRIADYRERPRVTLALAKEFDSDVLKWAITELLDEAKRASWEARPDASDGDDPALLPMIALVLEYDRERDAALEKVACQGAQRRSLLVEAIGEWGDGFDRELLQRIAASKTTSDEERAAVAKSLARLYARETGGIGETVYELLEQVIRREPIEAAPLGCSK